eukprot:2836965-Alexandrium_andersonii.AAC.2
MRAPGSPSLDPDAVDDCECRRPARCGTPARARTTGGWHRTSPRAWSAARTAGAPSGSPASWATSSAGTRKASWSPQPRCSPPTWPAAPA